MAKKVYPIEDGGGISRRNTKSSLHSSSPLVTLSWEDIDVNTPHQTARNWPLFGRKEIPSKNIVKKVSGIAKPGTLMAIMGASGAGKTTLLNVLNFRNRGNLKITGDVKINGSVVQSRSALASISGYVQQEDIFIGTLTVGELLRFQAYMRMDKSTTKEEKLARVDEIMNDLNLKKCKNTVIGAPDQGVKGISGGERRRLAFACELITNPNLMFCDEPTSGLDSFMAMTIVETMQRLAREGKTIVCTIHQPSSEVFELFDRLLLMAEGRVAYLGDLNKCPSFFAANGYSCPNNYNPADFYIQNLAFVPSNREESLERIKKICDGFDASQFTNELKEDIKRANAMENSPDNGIKLVNKTSYKANFLTQFKYLLWRSWLTNLRDPFSTKVAVIQTIAIALLLGLIFLRITYNQAGIQNINGIMFLMLINASFTNMLGVLHGFPIEIPIFLREHQNGMYAVAPYYLSKMIVDLPKFFILQIVYIIIVYWMANLNSDVGRFFICMIIIILVALTSISFGTLLSALAPSVDAALGYSGPVLIPLMIFSGFFLNNSSVPKYFIWLRYLSWFNYANELLVLNQWDGYTGISCSDSTSKCITTGAQIISNLDMSTSNYAVDFIAIICLLIGWRVLAFLVLLVKSYKK